MLAKDPFILALSSVSATVSWVAIDAANGKLRASRSWGDDQSRSLSDSIRKELEHLLVELGLAPGDLSAENLSCLYVLSGPGAFTGLRMGVAFAVGLARGLGVPLVGLPTWEVWRRPFCIPTRHQLAKSLSLDECVQQGFEFLRVLGPREASLVAKPEEGDLIVGLRDRPEWPSSEEVAAAVFAHFKKEALAKQSSVDIFYGMDPKISGQR